jgi:PAS domain S-box-containing protein/putative nucleotidyltransferase with HDIG domain
MIYNEAGDIVGTLSAGEDITERKQAEISLRESEERYRGLVETMFDGLGVDDERGKFTYVNERLCEILGRTREEIVGHPVTDFLDEESARIYKGKSTYRVGNAPASYELTFIRKDGRKVHTVVSPRVLRDSENNYTGSFAVITDITENKQRERELETIANVTQALREASSGQEMIPIIIEQIEHILNIEGAVFIYIDPNTRDYVKEIGYGVWEDYEDAIIDPGGITETVIMTGKPYVNNRAKTHPDRRDSQPAFTGRASAVACVPLTAHEEVVGVLWVGREAPIQGGNLRLLNSIGHIAANEIQRSTLYEKAVQNLNRLEALHNIDMAINASQDVKYSLHVLINQVTNLLGVDAACVFLYDEDTRGLKYAAGEGFHSKTEFEKASINLGNHFAGQIALERRTIKGLDLAACEVFSNYAKYIRGEGFSSYFGVPLIAKSRVVGVLEVYNRTPLNPETEWMDFLETLAGQAAIAIDNTSMYHELQRTYEQLSVAYNQTIEGWALTLEMRDDETKGHSQRVTEMAIAIAREMGIRDQELVHIRRGAILHDIGKMAIPDEVLHKPGPLTDEEWDLMRQHPTLAVEWLSKISFLEQAMTIPHYHHERWDGTGYPEGLKGEAIPLSARIFSIVDVWDALLSDRPYRKAWPIKKAITYIKTQSGKQFDPEVVKVFFNLVEKQPVIAARQ